MDVSALISQLISDINASEVNTVGSLFKLCLSMLLGSFVGLERKRKGQSAGIRTFALISMGATLAMILSVYVPQEYLGLKNGDPSRIAAQVISGIGFLGAGAIIQMKGSVRGLTTAAGIWIVAIIGMCVGLGMYLLSIVASLLIYFVLLNIERIEHRLGMGNQSRIIRLTVDGTIENMEPYRQLLSQHGVHVINMYVAYDYQAHTTSVNFVVLSRETTDYVALFRLMRDVNPTRALSVANQLSS